MLVDSRAERTWFMYSSSSRGHDGHSNSTVQRELRNRLISPVLLLVRRHPRRRRILRRRRSLHEIPHPSVSAHKTKQQPSRDTHLRRIPVPRLPKIAVRLRGVRRAPSARVPVAPCALARGAHGPARDVDGGGVAPRAPAAEGQHGRDEEQGADDDYERGRSAGWVGWGREGGREGGTYRLRWRCRCARPCSGRRCSARSPRWRRRRREKQGFSQRCTDGAKANQRSGTHSSNQHWRADTAGSRAIPRTSAAPRASARCW